MVLTAACRGNDVTRADRPASLHSLPGAHGRLDPLDRRVASGHDDAEGLGHLWRRFAGKSHPGDVCIHRARCVELAPQIQQHQFVRPNLP
jgi:hypothetical protein